MMTPRTAAKPLIHLLNLHNYSIFDQLQLEEALLRADTRNWCLLNDGSQPAIVMGISGKQEKLVDPTLMNKSPVPLIRRFSGGGTVFVDSNTIFATWIGNVIDTNVPCCPQKLHASMADFYQQAFPHLGMRLKENDYVIGQRKWGGNAQYLCKGRWLHHTSMLWDFEEKNMEYLLMPEKIPAYRESRGHNEFLCCLKEHFTGFHSVRENIVRHLHKQFSVCEVDLKDVHAILELPHRKATILI